MFRDPSFSPDGRSLAVASDDGHNAKYSIRIFDLERNVSRSLTEPGNASRPVWSPNGKDITYAETQGQVWYLYETPVDGSAPPRMLVSGSVMLPNSWSPGGYLAFQTTDTGLPSLEIYSAADRSVSRLTSGAEAQFSPDGKWIAYIAQGGVLAAVASSYSAFPVRALRFRSPGRAGRNPVGAGMAAGSSSWSRTAN